MSPSTAQQAYGVFKPVGHVIVALPSDADARGAYRALLDAGFASRDVVFYTPDDMVRQADIDIDQAGVLAGIGQELNLVKAHRELALQGASFIVVRAPDDQSAERVADIARQHRASRAQRYGHLTIEEMIEPGSGERQVGESPDRGLDPQTRSGHEAGASL
ncbi:MAG: hypothetical protein M3O01_00030 [Pseudomonadota bacterium]|nr:hypothetical protein [Pseudomonadota bacterium]